MANYSDTSEAKNIPSRFSPDRRRPTFVIMWECLPVKDTITRLTIDITEQQHKALKAMAALEGKTIRQFALEKLFPPHR